MKETLSWAQNINTITFIELNIQREETGMQTTKFDTLISRKARVFRSLNDNVF